MRSASIPLIVGSRTVAFSKAVAKLFFLETTMITVFGSDESFRFAVESISGAALFSVIVIANLGLVVYARRGLRELNSR